MFWKKQQQSNARRQKRMQADYLMMYQETGKEDVEPFVSNIKDLSSGGCRFLTEHFFREGTDFFIAIAIPPLHRNIECRARVMRIRPSERGLYFVGVRFFDLNKKDERDLDNFIESLAKDRGAWFMVDHDQRIRRKEEKPEKEYS